MGYTLEKGVRGMHLPQRYDVSGGTRRYLLPDGLPDATVPRTLHLEEILPYTAVPVLTVATILALSSGNGHAPLKEPSGQSRAPQQSSISTQTSRPSQNQNNLQSRGNSSATTSTHPSSNSSTPSAVSHSGSTATASPPPSSSSSTPSSAPAPVGGRGGGSLSPSDPPAQTEPSQPSTGDSDPTASTSVSAGGYTLQTDITVLPPTVNVGLTN